MPNSPERLTIMFRDDNINVRPTPSIKFDSPNIKACKLLDVQMKLFKRLKRKKNQLSIDSSLISYM